MMNNPMNEMTFPTKDSGLLSDTETASETASPNATKSRVLTAIKEFATLSQILRFAGAATMVASMSMFLLQGWDLGNDVNRYFLLLAQTMLLAGGGFALSYLLKENKGARVFFGLSLVSIPANFTILGAMIYSLVQWDGSLGEYPGFANWVAGDASALLLTMAAAMVVMVPLTVLGYSVIARRSARRLSIALLLSSATLLLPARGSLAVGLIIATAIMALLWLLADLARRDATLRTPEGVFARLLLFVPPIIVLVRSFLLYQPDAILAVTLGITSFVTMRQLGLQFRPTHWLRTILELASPVVAFVIAVALVDSFGGRLNDAAFVPIFTLTLAGLIAEVGTRAGRYSGLYLNSAAFFVAGLIPANLALFGGPLNAALCSLIGIAMLIPGFGLQRRFVMLCGAITLLSGLGYGAVQLLDWVDLGSWSTLAIVGTTAIVAGSVLDRHGAAMKLRVTQWFQRARTRAAKPTQEELETEL